MQLNETNDKLRTTSWSSTKTSDHGQFEILDPQRKTWSSVHCFQLQRGDNDDVYFFLVSCVVTRGRYLGHWTRAVLYHDLSPPPSYFSLVALRRVSLQSWWNMSWKLLFSGIGQWIKQGSKQRTGQRSSPNGPENQWKTSTASWTPWLIFFFVLFWVFFFNICNHHHGVNSKELGSLL